MGGDFVKIGAWKLRGDWAAHYVLVNITVIDKTVYTGKLWTTRDY